MWLIILNALHSDSGSYLDHLDLIVDSPEQRAKAERESPAKMLLQYKTRMYKIIHGGYNILDVSSLLGLLFPLYPFFRRILDQTLLVLKLMVGLFTAKLF